MSTSCTYPLNSLSETDNPTIIRLLDELATLESLDFSATCKVCPYSLITSANQLEALVACDRLHPEVIGLSHYAFQIAGVINYGPMRFRSDTGPSAKLREDLIRQLMSRLRIALRLRGSECWWVCATEYGYENRIHSHFIFGLNEKTNTPSERLISLLHHGFKELSKNFNEEQIGTLNLTPVINSVGAVAYLCKEEYRRPMKHFIFSQSIAPR
jgi:hypothetical protein